MGGIDEQEDEDILEQQDARYTKSDKIRYPEIQIEKSMNIQTLENKDTLQDEEPQKEEDQKDIKKFF